MWCCTIQLQNVQCAHIFAHRETQWSDTAEGFSFRNKELLHQLGVLKGEAEIAKDRVKELETLLRTADLKHQQALEHVCLCLLTRVCTCSCLEECACAVKVDGVGVRYVLFAYIEKVCVCVCVGKNHV